jgi:cytochrome c oxidase subunit 2
LSILGGEQGCNSLFARTIESKKTMKFGDFVRAARHSFKRLGLGVLASVLVAAPLAAAPQAALAAAATAPAAAAPAVADRFVVAPGGYTPMKPTPGKGMPVPGAIGFQTQYSPNGQYALWIHNSILLPIVFGTSIFVALLLLWVIIRYNKRANPTPSKTSHNTLLEVVWTGLPVLILAFVAIYSLDLLAKQFKPAPANALTIKATGNQWYWTYGYPDNGGFEVISNMLPDEKAIANGEPAQLAADYRMVVPAGEPIRLQTFGADVIHSFAVPSLWFKLDAVPGRINEKVLFVKEPGVYYGQCSELCGARHGYMPIVVEALDRPHFNAWVMTHSGAKIDGAPAAPAAAAPAAATPAAAPAAEASTSSAPAPAA